MPHEAMTASKNEMYMTMARHYEEKENLDKAKEFYIKSVDLEPSSVAHERLGLIFRRKNDMDAARIHFSEALRLNPASVLAIYNMAFINRLDGDYEGSMEKYLLLKSMGVNDPGVDTGIGVLNSEIGNVKEAMKCYEASMLKNPDNELVRFNYSLSLLALGEFDKGLELYENRIWHARPPGKEWMGDMGENILVLPEQGNGDIIQFARFIPLLKPFKKCEKIVFLCNRPLVELMKTVEGVDEVIEFNPGDEFVEPNNSDVGDSDSIPFGRFVRIMSIPHKLGLDPSKIQFKKYLGVDPKKVDAWRERMGPRKKFRVGLCWRGGRRDEAEMAAIDRRRSMDPESILPILGVENVEFFSLQKEGQKLSEVNDFMAEAEDFVDTAAIIENLDLVISVDTAVAHMAAALEKPTWMMSRKGGCWRWGLDGESTFWYPSMRIFRQEELNNWTPVISKITEELRKSAGSKRN